jgi:hypothetical protein
MLDYSARPLNRSGCFRFAAATGTKFLFMTSRNLLPPIVLAGGHLRRTDDTSFIHHGDIITINHFGWLEIKLRS